MSRTPSSMGPPGIGSRADHGEPAERTRDAAVAGQEPDSSECMTNASQEARVGDAFRGNRV